MIRLRIAAEDSILFSDLCASCPQGPTGCCAAPPAIDWSDLARIVRHGGRDWVLEEIAAKRLLPTSTGLALARVKTRASPLEQRRARCVYHGPTGCTIAHERRSATCNYYLCDDALTEGGLAKGEPSALQAKALHTELRAQFEREDETLAKKIAEHFPDGVLSFDAGFLDWLIDQRAALALRAHS